MQTFKDATISPEDTTQQRMDKLYLGICSIGEQLYSAGSLLSEMNKKLLSFEKEIADFRREFRALKQTISENGK
jgi:hypothetical protein